MRDHRKLEAFQLADGLVFSIYRITSSFPRSERFGLTGQMRRSAISIAANIVEGCGRESRRDFLRFLGMSFGSARELGYYIGVADRLGYISEDQYARVDEAHGRATAALASLIRGVKVLRP